MKLPHSTSGNSLASPTTPTSNPFIDVTRGLTLTKVPGSPQKSSDLPKLQNYGAIPSINDYFDVRITMSANPSNFTVNTKLIYLSISVRPNDCRRWKFCIQIHHMKSLV